jgi:hypothetical protein
VAKYNNIEAGIALNLSRGEDKPYFEVIKNDNGKGLGKLKARERFIYLSSLRLARVLTYG